MSSENPSSQPSVSEEPQESSNDSVQAEQMPESERFAELMQLKELLMKDSHRLAARFIFTILFFILAVGLLVVASRQFYWFTVGRYAVVKNVQVTQNPGNQGQLEISYEVLTPGRVFLRRSSDGIDSDLFFDYKKPCREVQHWNWNYKPGLPIQVALWSRQGVNAARHSFQFPTFAVADIVILMDSTESMGDSIRALKEKFQSFAVDLQEQNIQPRFALIAFGDAKVGGEWFSASEFMTDSVKFEEILGNIQRFSGGDAPESVLDALGVAVEKVKKESVGHAIRFYLVTDQEFHVTSADGKLDVSSVTKLLKENRVMLEVFGNPRFQEQYEPLLGDCGHFREISHLGEVLTQGRFLED